ncbi:hypothetical protein [Vulcanisaeta distributa]|uniref:hypothetical protein n=1 Tax=Vulcanisaeta distributa TaxID=164451 RepID=UPI000ADA8E7C|nr:hypothetical protein [Vulcanisaeta distributa]
MPIWVYYLDEFKLISDYDFDYTVNELIGMAISEAEKVGIKPATVCQLKVNEDVIIEVRGNDGQVLKLIKARDPTRALEEFYENEGVLACSSVG